MSSYDDYLSYLYGDEEEEEPRYPWERSPAALYGQRLDETEPSFWGDFLGGSARGFVRAGQQLAAGAVGAGETALQAADFASRIHPMVLLDRAMFSEKWESIEKDREAVREKLRTLADRLGPEDPAPSTSQRIVEGAFRSLPTSAAIAAAYGTGGPLLGGAAAAGAIGPGEYEKARELGASKPAALGIAGASTAAQTALENLGMGALFGNVLRGRGSMVSPAVRRVIEIFGVEPTTEAAQEVVSMAAEHAAGRNLDEILAEAPSRVGTVAASAAVSAPLLAGLGRAPSPEFQTSPVSPEAYLGDRPPSPDDLTPSLASRWLGSTKGLPARVARKYENAVGRAEQRDREAFWVAMAYNGVRRQYLADNPGVDANDLDLAAFDWLTKPQATPGKDLPSSAPPPEVEGHAELGRGINAPPELLPYLRRMRDDIDTRTAELLAVDAFPTPAQADYARDNMGRYLARQYLSTRSSSYRRKVRKSPLWDEVKQDILRGSDISRDLPQEQRGSLAEGMMNRALVKEPRGWYGNDTGDWSTTSDAFKHLKDVPAWQRKLMGEIKDPLAGYLMTMERTSRELELAKLYGDLRQGELGRLFFTEPTKEAYEQIPPSHGDIGGLYTSPELRSSLTAYMGRWGIPSLAYPDSPTGIDAIDRYASPVVRAFERGMSSRSYALLTTVNGVAKVSATILSPRAQVRNAQSNVLALMATGNLLPFAPGRSVAEGVAALKDGFKAGAAAAFGVTNEEARNSVRRWAKQGILNTNVDLGDIELYLGDTFGKLGQEGSPGKKVLSASAAGYRFGDEAFKLANAFAEAYTLRAIHPEWSAEQVDFAAGELTKRHMQNYQRIPAVVNTIRVIPFVGPFVAFPIASALNFKNILATSARELSHARTAPRGAQRLGSLAAAVSLPTVATYAALRALGLDWDEDKIEDARRLLPPHMRNSELVITGEREGEYQVLDLSYTDYYQFLKKPLRAFLRGEDFEQSLMMSLKEAIEPFVNEEIAAGALLDAFQGETASGQRVWHPTDTLEQKLLLGMAHVGQALTPGAIRDARELYSAIVGRREKEYKEPKVSDALIAFAGPRLYTVPVGRGLKFAASRESRRRQNAVNALNQRATSRLPGTLMMAESTAQRAQEVALESYRELERLRNTGLRFGLSEEEVGKWLHEGGTSKRETRAILAGQAEAVAATWWQERRGKVVEKRADQVTGDWDDWLRRNPGATATQREKKRQELMALWRDTWGMFGPPGQPAPELLGR